MSEHDERSGRDVDVDAERFVDEEDSDNPLTRAVDLPAEGSIPDIIDQHIAVPADEEP